MVNRHISSTKFTCESAMYLGYIDPVFGGSALYAIGDKQWSFPTINNNENINDTIIQDCYPI